MADGVVLNSGSGGVTAVTDDCGVAGHAQVVKLAISTDASATLVPADATNGMQVNVTKNVPGTGATNLGKAEDDAAASGDVGIALLTKRQDTPTADTSLDGDYQHAKSSSTGRLFTSATVDAALPAGTNNIGDVDVLTVPAPLSTTGGGTEAAALRVTVASDSTGVLSVDDNGGSLTVDGSVSLAAAIPAGTNNIGDMDVLSLVPGTGATNLGKAEDDPAASGDVGVAVLTTRQDTIAGTTSLDGDYQALKTNSVGRLYTTATVDAALPAGTNNIGDVDVLSLPALAAGTNNIGDVDVLTLPALPAGTNNIGDVDVLSGPTGASALQQQGAAAHDAATAGNPVLVGAQMETMADSAPGTRSGTDGDATKLATTDGALFAIPGGPQTWSYHENSSSALTDTSVHAAPGAGLSLYISTIVVSTGAATALNIFFEEGASTVLGPYYLEAVAGRGLVITFGVPKKITANTALTVTTSAAIAHSIDITGFVAPG